MGKRGRKPNPEKRTGYFYEEQEAAFVEYLTSDDMEHRNRVFQEKLYPAFSKMIESIIRRYNLFVPMEDFEDSFHDTMSFLLTKIENFDVTTGKKAYSYCGTICKHYLIHKIETYRKNRKRVASYDETGIDISEEQKYYHTDYESDLSIRLEIINEVINEIECMLNDETMRKKMTPNEIKVGYALVQFLKEWDELMANMGSNKFNKSSFILYICETTLLKTDEVREAMKMYRKLFFVVKKNVIS